MSVASGIYTFCQYLSIAVFLNEFPITQAVYIKAFETLAVLILLDGSTVTLAVLVNTLEFRAVGITHDALTMGLTVLEIAFHGITALLRQFALAMLLV